MTSVRQVGPRSGTYKTSPSVRLAHELTDETAVGVIPCTAASDHRRGGVGASPRNQLNTLFLNGVGLKRLPSRRRVAVSPESVCAADPSSRIARRSTPANSRIHHVRRN